MTLRVAIRANESWLKSAEYAIGEIAEVCGLSVALEEQTEAVPIGTLVYGPPGQALDFLGGPKGSFIVRIPCLWPDAHSVEGLLQWDSHRCVWEGETRPLSVRSPTIPSSKGRPIARWVDDKDPAIVLTESGGVVVVDFSFDPVSSFFLAVSQGDEDLIVARDIHGRVPQARTFPIARGAALLPIATDSALLLGKAVATASEEAGAFLVVKAPWPGGIGAVACITHDVDSVRKWSLPRTVSWLRQRGRPIGRQPNQKRGRQTLHEIAQIAGFRDPHRNLGSLMKLEKDHDVRATYFLLMAKRPGHREPKALYGYRDPYLRSEMKHLKSEGHELALHSSYESADEPALLRDEVARLSLVHQPAGARQHYLRINPEIWREQESVGLTYDSSIGYSEFVGFRSGACHPYHPYEAGRDRTFSILEIPPVVMDSGLYETCSGRRSEMERILGGLMDAVAYRNGILVSIWHNQYLDGELVGPGSVLEWLISRLKTSGWWFTTMAEAAHWWQSRESVRMGLLDPDIWRISVGRGIEECAFRVVGDGDIEVQNVPRGGWEVKNEKRSRLVVIHKIPPSTEVFLKRTRSDA